MSVDVIVGTAQSRSDVVFAIDAIDVQADFTISKLAVLDPAHPGAKVNVHAQSVCRTSQFPQSVKGSVYI